MTHICPYCGGKMKKPPPEYDMTKKQGMVYQTILAAGPDGVSVETLNAGLFKGKSAVNIRTTVYHINKVIYPARIRSRCKIYSLQA